MLVHLVYYVEFALFNKQQCSREYKNSSNNNNNKTSAESTATIQMYTTVL